MLKGLMITSKKNYRKTRNVGDTLPFKINVKRAYLVVAPTASMYLMIGKNA